MSTLLSAINQSSQQGKHASGGGGNRFSFDDEFQSSYEAGGELAIAQIKQAAAAASGQTPDPDAGLSEEEKKKKKIAETKAKMAKDPSFAQEVKNKVGG